MLQLQGLARMTLRPLTDVLPCIGAITVTLMETPYLDFSLHILESFDIMQIPGIKQGVNYAMERVSPPQLCAAGGSEAACPRAVCREDSGGGAG